MTRAKGRRHGPNRVHTQVHRRHPELADEDVKTAFCDIFAHIHRADGECVGVGMDGHRRLVELVFRECEGVMVVYHALTPSTRKVMVELGMPKG